MKPARARCPPRLPRSCPPKDPRGASKKGKFNSDARESIPLSSSLLPYPFPGLGRARSLLLLPIPCLSTGRGWKKLLRKALSVLVRLRARKRPTGGTVEWRDEETRRRRGEQTRGRQRPTPELYLREWVTRQEGGTLQSHIVQVWVCLITIPLGVNCPLRGHRFSWSGAEALPPTLLQTSCSTSYLQYLRHSEVYYIFIANLISKISHDEGRGGEAPRFPSPAQD